MKLGYWKTKDGTVLTIAEMGTAHLKHCVAMLTRQIAAEDASVAVFGTLNGEMAREAAADPAGASMYNAHVFRLKRIELEEELAKRQAACDDAP